MTTESLEGRGPAATGRKRRDSMLWLVAGIFLAYILTNGIMLYVSMLLPPVLVSQTYYEDSRTFEGEQSAENASDAAGWRVATVTSSTAEITFRLTDRAGHAASGFSGLVNAYRPNDAGLDQTLAWKEDPAVPGQYRATFSRPHAGQWQIHLQLQRGGERLNHEIRWVAP
jgi:nitrogen fixation protein FixH